MISTLDLSKWMAPNQLKRLSQSLAVLDAIIEPDWELRYYSFDAHWGTGQEMASMRNGEGGHYFLLFGAEGAILKGFSPESPMNPYRQKPPQVWAGIIDGVPQCFASFLEEPAFALDETTFLVWHTSSDSSWQRGSIEFPQSPDPDGSIELLALLDSHPKTYCQWAQEYYERSISLSAVTHIYQHRPLSQEIVEQLNSGSSLSAIAEDIQEIGY